VRSQNVGSDHFFACRHPSAPLTFGLFYG